MYLITSDTWRQGCINDGAMVVVGGLHLPRRRRFRIIRVVLLVAGGYEGHWPLRPLYGEESGRSEEHWSGWWASVCGSHFSSSKLMLGESLSMTDIAVGCLFHLHKNKVLNLRAQISSRLNSMSTVWFVDVTLGISPRTWASTADQVPAGRGIDPG